MPGTPRVETELDLLHPAERQDPFPLYRRLREQDPVHWSARLRMWIVTRYDDVNEVLQSPDAFSVDRFRHMGEELFHRRPDLRAVAHVLGDWAVYRDPPEHTRLRALLGHAFVPRAIEVMRPVIHAVVDTLLDRIEADEPVEFIRDFAFPLPATVIGRLLGVPAADIDRVKAWSDRIAAYVGGACEAGHTVEQAKLGLLEACAYFRDLVRARGTDRSGDLLGLLMAAEDRGQVLSEDELVANCILLLFAGHETTTNLLANGLLHLLRNPEQHRRLVTVPELVASAVEEFLRYDPPVAGTLRVAIRAVELGGRAIRRGEMVAAMLAAANRDPRQFDRPDDLDIGRTPNRHLAFGHGIHFCLGAGLARLEAQIAIGSLLARFPRLALVEDAPRWKSQVFFRGLEHLWLEVGR